MDTLSENKPVPRNPTPPPGGTPRILVVEDEETLSLLLAYNLESEGFVVECVERGDEADLRLVEAPPDLVILDWMLPGVSGLEICRRMRARQATRTLPVIMLRGARRANGSAASRLAPTTISSSPSRCRS
jgi:two-component system phosphate regulon response regulator PhoB